MDQFHPISLCNVVYKINTKLIPERLKPWLKPWLSSLISNEQGGIYYSQINSGWGCYCY